MNIQLLIEHAILSEAAPKIGETGENKTIRYHRYRSAVQVTDLMNAGRRGKKVDQFSLYDLDMVNMVAPDAGRHLADAINKWIASLPKSNYAKAKKGAEDIAKLASKLQLSSPKLSMGRSLRGIDVAPGGFKELKIDTKEFTLRSGYDSFVVNDKSDQNNLPACIPAVRGKKSDIKAFYRWVTDNEAKIKKMTFSKVMSAMNSAGINYHYYCRMD